MAGVMTLTYAVRFRVVGRYLGQLALMLALLQLVPLVVSAFCGEFGFAWRYAVSVTALAVAGAVARRFPEPDQIQINEAVVVVAMTFIGASLIATFPLTAGGLGFVDAWFEAVSAVTTTGLSVGGGNGQLSRSVIFARAWMQWYGGLGIAALSVALFIGQHTAARRLVEPTETENLATTARIQVRQVLRVYGVLTLAGVAVLWPVTGNGFVAIQYVLAAVSTGGFAPLEASLAALPVAGAWIVTALAVLGAVPLVVYAYAARGRPAALMQDPEVRALVLALLLAAVLVSVSLHGFSGLDWAAAFHHGALLGMSAQSTSGFTALPLTGIDPVSKLLLMASMAVGGATGSTAGGIKLLRVLVILKVLQYFMRRTAMPPHATDQPRFAGQLLEPADVERVALVMASFAVLAGLSWLALVSYGYEPLNSLFEVISALGTVGLSTGIASPTLATPLKLVLCADMLLGRLDLLVLLVLLYPRTWIGRRT